MQKKYRSAVIGCGRIGYENDKNIKNGPYSHYKAVMQNKNFQLIAVAEINKNIRQHISKNKNLKVYSSYEKLLKDNSTSFGLLDLKLRRFKYDVYLITRLNQSLEYQNDLKYYLHLSSNLCRVYHR